MIQEVLFNQVSEEIRIKDKIRIQNNHFTFYSKQTGINAKSNEFLGSILKRRDYWVGELKKLNNNKIK